MHVFSFLCLYLFSIFLQNNTFMIHNAHETNIGDTISLRLIRSISTKHACNCRHLCVDIGACCSECDIMLLTA
jgi:hypothetical protein